MSLTLGTGPFAGTAAGAVNFDWDGAPAHRLLFEPYGRRLRAVVNPDRTLLEDAAWSYETPLSEALKAQGHVTFGDPVEIDISG